MATKFLGTDAWKRIKALNKRPGRRLVAIPYLGENASRRLRLKAGDVLVVRLDMATVKTGQTSPPWGRRTSTGSSARWPSISSTA
jgi:hypothetical protein